MSKQTQHDYFGYSIVWDTVGRCYTAVKEPGKSCLWHKIYTELLTQIDEEIAG